MPASKRTEQANVRLSREEYDDLNVRAERLGMSVSQYIRLLLLRHHLEDVSE